MKAQHGLAFAVAFLLTAAVLAQAVAVQTTHRSAPSS
jgi:hypothetical protein